MSNMNWHGGRNVFLGAIYQAASAFSLILQYTLLDELTQVVLEGKNLEDFCIFLKCNKKIICESKAYRITYSKLRDILKKVDNHKKIQLNDELLIICKSVSPEIKSDIAKYDFVKDHIKDKYTKKKNFKPSEFKMLRQVKFWEISEKDIYKTSLFLLASFFKIWIPKNRFEEVAHSILYVKIYHGSSKGELISKDQILQLIKSKENEIRSDLGLMNQQKEIKAEISNITKAIDSQVFISNNMITELTSEYWKIKLTLEILEHKKNLNLRQWDKLWIACSDFLFSSEVFSIFKKNLDKEENINYFFEFAENLFDEKCSYFRDYYGKFYVVDNLNKVLDCTSNFNNRVLHLIKHLFKPSIKRHFFINTDQPVQSEYDDELTGELLLKLYSKSDCKLKKEIIEYIKAFNLVNDSSFNKKMTPNTIFKIHENHYKENLNGLLEELVSKINDDYTEFYNRYSFKSSFNGWDSFGGFTSYWEDNIRISDQAFISCIFKPILKENYEKNPDYTFNFVSEKMISRQISNVSSKHPDYLNRASLNIILDEYMDGTQTQKAFEILKDFISMRKGIPSKSDLLFYMLLNIEKYENNEKKWKLVEYSLKLFNGLPSSIFVERIVLEYALAGKTEAVQYIKNWATNDEYLRRQSAQGIDLIYILSEMVKRNELVFDAIEILEKYISSKHFYDPNMHIDSFKLTKLIALVLNLGIDKGIEVLKLIYNGKFDHQQQMIFSQALSLFQSTEKSKHEKLYKTFVGPFIKEFKGKNEKFENKFTNEQAREQFVHFAEKMAEIGLMKESLDIISFFVKDSDPPKDGSNKKNDPEGNFNFHNQILKGNDDFFLGSVRGYCGWSLRHFSTIKGREYIGQSIIPILDCLIKDENYFVKYQALSSLGEFIKNSHSVLPDNHLERFISLDDAQKLEDLFFYALYDVNNISVYRIHKSLANCLNSMRSFDDQKALTIFQNFVQNDFKLQADALSNNQKTPYEMIIDIIAPIFIYYAEFRKNSFNDAEPEIWGKDNISKLQQFNDKPIQALLKELLNQKNTSINADYAWHFNQMINDCPNNSDMFACIFEIAHKYLSIIVGLYSKAAYDHVYRFIEQYIDFRYFECISLWKRCIEIEKKYLQSHYKLDNFQELYWWPNMKNDWILLKIKENEGFNEFYKWLMVLIDEYPEKILPFYSRYEEDMLDYLKNLPTEDTKVKIIFETLIKRNPRYYKYMKVWEDKEV